MGCDPLRPALACEPKPILTHLRLARPLRVRARQVDDESITSPLVGESSTSASGPSKPPEPRRKKQRVAADEPKARTSSAAAADPRVDGYSTSASPLGAAATKGAGSRSATPTTFLESLRMRQKLDDAASSPDELKARLETRRQVRETTVRPLGRRARPMLLCLSCNRCIRRRARGCRAPGHRSRRRGHSA